MCGEIPSGDSGTSPNTRIMLVSVLFLTVAFCCCFVVVFFKIKIRMNIFLVDESVCDFIYLNLN